MTKKLKVQFAKPASADLNGFKEDADSSTEVDTSKRLLAPRLRLPSVKLCLYNTFPISCLKSHVISKKLKMRNRVNFRKLAQLDLTESPSDRSNFRNIAIPKAEAKSLEELAAELYLMDLLSRMIKLGIANKMHILSHVLFSINRSACFRLNFSAVSLVKHLLRSVLSKESRYKFAHKTVALSPDSTEDVREDDFLCLDDSALSMFDGSFGPSRAPGTPPEPPLDSLPEDQMVENLLSGKLCNGAEATDFKKLLLSILVVNKYDHLPPTFLTRILSSQRVTNFQL